MTARIPSFENTGALDRAPISVPEISPAESVVASPKTLEIDGRLRDFVIHALRDLVGRAASAREVEGWVGQLASGASRATLASCLLNSSERRDRWVQRMYQRYLKRPATHDMLRYWSEQLGARRTQEEVLAGILSSPEYLALHGQRHDQFVRALYRDCSAHRPSNEEVDAWVGLIDSACASRMSVAFQFISAEEFRRRTIREWYLNYLEREPDHDAVAYCLEQLKAGISPERVQAEILASREYFNRAIRFAQAS